MSVKKTICTMCGRKSWLISEEQACGKTFQMTYQAPSYSKISKDWTSVDAPPKKDGEYLIVAFDRDGDAFYGIADYFAGCDASISWSIDTVFIKQNNITHWMPLPEAPKPIESDGNKKENNDGIFR